MQIKVKEKKNKSQSKLKKIAAAHIVRFDFEAIKLTKKF